MTPGGATIRRCVALVAMAAAALTVAACGTHRVDPAASPSSTLEAEIPPTPAASEYISAVLNSRTRGSAKVGTTITIDAPDGKRVLVGRGSAFLEPGYGLMTWSPDGSSSFVEMVNDDGVFVQSDPPDGRWDLSVGETSNLSSGPIGTTTTSGSFDPLRELGVLENIVDEGTEQLGKVVATRYSGTLPVTPDELRAIGLTESEIAALGDSWQGVDEQVTVWVDPSSLVAKVDRFIDLSHATSGPLSVRSTAKIGNFGSTLDVTSPSSSLVDTVTAKPE